MNTLRFIKVFFSPIEVSQLYPYIMTRQQWDDAVHFFERVNNLRDGILPMGVDEI